MTEVAATFVGGDIPTVRTVFGVTVSLLLLVLLIYRELLRVWDGPRARAGLKTLAIVTVPLGFMFVLVIVVRFVDLIR